MVAAILYFVVATHSGVKTRIPKWKFFPQVFSKLSSSQGQKE